MLNERFWSDRNAVRFLGPEEELPSKLVAVPKTATKPRLIAEEPTCMQFVQQGIMRSLVKKLESPEIRRQANIASSFIGFTDQIPNQEMARVGSAEGTLATLDLSDASDSVANWLVEALFEDFPVFSEAVESVRTRRVQLPSGEVHTLQKFASMGSALTFPLEAMVFASIALTAVLAHRGLSPTTRSLKELRGVVRVYGDDIIVPNDCAETVSRWLWIFGFKVNADKSFWTGEFRESCGKEYWKGFDVSVVKFRKQIPQTRHDDDYCERVISTVETRNHLYRAGLESLAESLDVHLEALLGDYPVVLPTSPVLGRVHKSNLYQVDKMHPDLHTPLVKGWKVRPRLPKSGLSESRALFKCLVSTVGNPDVPSDHLDRSGRPLGVSINRGYGSPF